jgi:hypothetical protein
MSLTLLKNFSSRRLRGLITKRPVDGAVSLPAVRCFFMLIRSANLALIANEIGNRKMEMEALLKATLMTRDKRPIMAPVEYAAMRRICRSDTKNRRWAKMPNPIINNVRRSHTKQRLRTIRRSFDFLWKFVPPMLEKSNTLALFKKYRCARMLVQQNMKPIMTTW